MLDVVSICATRMPLFVGGHDTCQMRTDSTRSIHTGKRDLQIWSGECISRGRMESGVTWRIAAFINTQTV